MVRVNRQSYAGYINIDLGQYSDVHGIIEAYGGRVKQFTQDVKTTDDWYMFFEMSNLNKDEFMTEMNQYLLKNKR